MPEDLHDTQNSVSEPAAFPKRDFRQEVTDQIIEMLENGTAPWQTPWEPGALQLPHNPTTNRAYRGGNALHLMAVGARKGFDDPRWPTYRQAQENGWQVRKGEKGSQIEFWQFDTRGRSAQGQEDDLEADRNVAGGSNPIRRVYTVFNAKQIDGIPNLEPKRRTEWELAETGESILLNSGAEIRHDQRDRAFYGGSEDAVHLPQQDGAATLPA